MGKIFAAELFQRGAVNILVNDLVQPFPKAQGLALGAVGQLSAEVARQGTGTISPSTARRISPAVIWAAERLSR